LSPRRFITCGDSSYGTKISAGVSPMPPIGNCTLGGITPATVATPLPNGIVFPMMLESPPSRVRQNEWLTITSAAARLAVGFDAFSNQVGGMPPRAGSRPRTRREFPETTAP
jgi:hypothetical protein